MDSKETTQAQDKDQDKEKLEVMTVADELLKKIAMAANLRPGKLYRLKRVMHVTRALGSLEAGSVLLLVDYQKNRIDVMHDLTFILPDGETALIKFLGENISRYLEPCLNSQTKTPS